VEDPYYERHSLRNEEGNPLNYESSSNICLSKGGTRRTRHPNNSRNSPRRHLPFFGAVPPHLMTS
jgi:hypothetical protein